MIRSILLLSLFSVITIVHSFQYGALQCRICHCQRSHYGIFHRNYHDELKFGRILQIKRRLKGQPLLLNSMSNALAARKDDDDENKKIKLKKRKSRVVIGYLATSMLYLIAGFRASLAYVKTGAPLASGLLLFSGPAIVSGVCYIMSVAASHSRLKSDTYKRLTIMLAKYGLLGLIVAALLRPLREPFFISASLWAIIDGIKGFVYGSKGWDLSADLNVVKEDLFNVFKNTIKVFETIPKNRNAFGYWVATGIFSTLCLMQFWMIVQSILSSTNTSLPIIGTYIARLARLNVLTVLLVTLKDASDRDRLDGTTFIQLNQLTSFGLAATAAYYFERSNVFSPLGLASVFFSSFAATNSLISIANKSEKK